MKIQRHTISIVSQNVPGILSKISGLLRRKLMNVESLTVGRTTNPKLSRFTLVLQTPEDQARKAIQALLKFIEVIDIKLLDPKNLIEREIVLVKILITSQEQELQLVQACKMVLCKEVFRDGEVVILELADQYQRLKGFANQLLDQNIEIIEWVRSGVVAIEKP